MNFVDVSGFYTLRFIGEQQQSYLLCSTRWLKSLASFRCSCSLGTVFTNVARACNYMFPGIEHHPTTSFPSLKHGQYNYDAKSLLTFEGNDCQDYIIFFFFLFHNVWL